MTTKWYNTVLFTIRIQLLLLQCNVYINLLNPQFYLSSTLHNSFTVRSSPLHPPPR